MGSLVDSYSAFAIDLDGVIWRGQSILVGAAQAIATIRRAEKPLLLLTNNAAYTPSFVAKRLGSSGIDVDPSEVLSSGGVAREWIKRHGFTGVSTIVIGSPEVVEQFRDIVDLLPPHNARDSKLVLVARDPEFDFAKLNAAAEAVRNGAEFLAVNRDAVLPVERGLEPGTGAILAAIEVASGHTATVLGKPEAPMMDLAVGILGRSGVLMIGDRIDSDILGAKRVGWASALVLSGVTSHVSRVNPKPDHVIDDLSAI